MNALFVLLSRYNSAADAMFFGFLSMVFTIFVVYLFGKMKDGVNKLKDKIDDSHKNWKDINKDDKDSNCNS